VHKLPVDLREALIANATALDAWKDITPLARNEFICWSRMPSRPRPGSVGFAGPGRSWKRPAPTLLLGGVQAPRAHQLQALIGAQVGVWRTSERLLDPEALGNEGLGVDRRAHVGALLPGRELDRLVIDALMGDLFEQV
jgi:hypothetical protein